jgi:hypothetical protein
MPAYKFAGVLPSTEADLGGARLELGGHQLGYFVGVQSGTLAKVVADHEKVDGVVKFEGFKYNRRISVYPVVAEEVVAETSA